MLRAWHAIDEAEPGAPEARFGRWHRALDAYPEAADEPRAEVAAT